MAPYRRLQLETLEQRELLTVAALGPVLDIHGESTAVQTTYSQSRSPTVAVDADGDFVAVWASEGPGGDGYEIRGRRYNAAAIAQGGEFQVNTSTSSQQKFPCVAMDGDGDFVVAWSSLFQDGSDYGIYAQRFDSAGAAQGPEFRVNSHLAGSQVFPAVAMNAAGDFVVAWTSQDQDGSGAGIFAQRFDPTGTPLGDEFQVNAHTDGNQRYATAAIDSAGNFVVTWTSQDQDGSGGGIYARRFAPDGTPQDSEFLVNATTLGNQQFSTVDIDPAGEFVVAWQSFDVTMGAWEIYARRFDSAGTPLIEETPIGTGRYASVATGPGGDFAVAWETYPGSGGLPSQIMLRHFDGYGAPTSQAGLTHEASAASHYGVSTAAVDQNLVVLWTGDDSGNPDVFGGRFETAVQLGINHRPILATIADQTARVDEPLTFTATAIDPDFADTLTFSLDFDAPAGAAIDPITGVFTWTPSAAQGPGTYVATIRITDDDSPALDDAQTVTLTVTDGAGLPTLQPLPDVVLAAGAPLHVALSGADPQGDPLSYTVAHTGAGLTTLVPEGNRSLSITVRDFGDMTLELFESRAPRTTGRIIELAESGFYDGLTFHRIIDDFMIQGGSSDGNGTAGSGVTFDDEFHPDLQHTSAGVLSMAKSSDDTNDSQFFITDAPTRNLDYNHSIFGFLTAGNDVRQAVQTVAADSAGRPDEAVIIDSVRVMVDRQDGVLMLSAPEGTTGEADVTVTVDDGQGETASRTFHVIITSDADSSANARPYLLPIDDVHTTVDTPASFTIAAMDVEGDPIFYSGAVEPASADVALDVAELDGSAIVTPSNGFVGVQELLLSVGAQSGQAWDNQAVALWVHPPAPAGVELLAISDTGANDADQITRLNNEPDNTLQLRVTGVLPGMEITAYAGATPIAQGVAAGTSITLATDATHVLADGVHQITAVQTLRDQSVSIGNRDEVVDLASENSASLPITVDTSPPIFSSSPIATAVVGTPYVYDVETDDEAAGLVLYELPDAPATMTIDPQTGILAWTPTGSSSVPVTVIAVDAAGNVGKQAFSLVLNGPPQLYPIADQTVMVGDTLSLTVSAVDPDTPAQQLRFALNPGAPLGMTIDAASGLLAWTPDLGQTPGVHAVTVRVTDDGTPALDDVASFSVELLDPMPTTTTDWGSVAFLEVPGEAVSDGDRYLLRAMRDGQLTVEAHFSSAAGNIDLTLLDADGAVLDASATSNDVERLDAPVAAGQLYQVVVAGSNPAAEFRLANLLTESATTLTVFGTEGDDTLHLAAGVQHELVVNGFTYHVDASTITTLAIHGGGGADAITLHDSAGQDTLKAGPDWANFSGDGFSYQTTGFEAVVATSTGGDDVAFLYDSPGDDLFAVDDTYGALTGGLPGETFALAANDFRYVHAYSTAGGTDTAELHGTAGKETVVTRPTDAKIIGAEHFGRAWYFDAVAVHGGGGDDIAVLYDSAAQDTLRAWPTETTFSSGLFDYEILGVGSLQAYSTGGDDVAFLYDSPGDDTLVVDDTHGALTGGTFSLSVNDFRYVHGYSTAGGTDTAELYGTAGKETVVTRPTDAKIIGAEHFGRAWYFDAVTVHGGGGDDLSVLYDSTGQDTLRASPTETTFSGNLFDYEILGTGSLQAYSTGGDDVAFLYDSPGDDLLVVNDTYGSLTGGTFSLSVNDFRYVHGYATAGGTDTAELYGTAGPETVVTRPTDVKLLGTEHFGRAWYFDRVIAKGGGGDDVAVLYDADPQPGFTPLDPAAMDLGTYYWLWELEDYTVVNGDTTHFDAVDEVYTAYWD